MLKVLHRLRELWEHMDAMDAGHRELVQLITLGGKNAYVCSCWEVFILFMGTMAGSTWTVEGCSRCQAPSS